MLLVITIKKEKNNSLSFIIRDIILEIGDENGNYKSKSKT